MMTNHARLKFLADENVAKLGKWLRTLGFDVAYQSPATDEQLALKARRENRIILTRDRGFPKRRIVEQCLLLRTHDPIQQLKRVIKTYDLKLDRERFFSRCLDCNTPIRPITKEKVRSSVPDYIYQTHDRFHQCPNCNKLFWPGTHTENFQQWLQRIRED